MSFLIEARIRTHTKAQGDMLARAPAVSPQARLKAKRFARPTARKAPQSAPPIWTKAPPLVLTEAARVDDAIAVIGSACRTHWKVNLASALDGRDPEGVHQVRVSLRRFRSALSIFKKYIPETQRTALNREAKWLLGELGRVRDLDVFIHTLAKPFAERVSDDARLAQLVRAARLARAKAHAEAAKALKSTRTGRFAARLDAWLAGRGWNAPDGEKVRDATEEQARDFAERSLNRRLRKIKAAYGDVDELSVDERHELRIAAKKLRYGIEFFVALLPEKRMARMSTGLKHLQDSLGHLNDIDVAERTITALTQNAREAATQRKIAAGGRVISRWHTKAAKAAEPETARLWRKVKKLPAF